MSLHPSVLTSPAPIASGRDAEIVAACNKFAELEIQLRAPGFPEVWPTDFRDAYESAFDDLLEFKATTAKGFYARERTLAIYLYPDEAADYPLLMVRALLGDMLGLETEACDA